MKPIAMKPAWAVMLLAAALMGGAHAKSRPADASDKPLPARRRKNRSNPPRLATLAKSNFCRVPEKPRKSGALA